MLPVPCILEMNLVPPSLPRSSYESSSFGLYCSTCLVSCLCPSSVCVVATFPVTLLFPLLYSLLLFPPNTLVFFLYLFLLFQEGVLKVNQLDAKFSQVFYLTFMYSSTCFGRPHAHHWSSTTEIAASGFTVGAWW